MKIIVKVLQGEECTLEVSNQISVLELKQRLHEALKVPVDQQKLLLTGRPLADEKYLVDYPSIKDGTKLNLIVKKIVDGDGEQDTTLLREATYKFLRNFYPESTSLKIVEEFIKEFHRSISTLSLDDFDRIATSYLEEEEKMS